MQDDRYHGSEDYPAPTKDPFQEWEQEWVHSSNLEWDGNTWTGLDTWLRRMLMAGGIAVLWLAVGVIAVIAVKGDL